MKYPAEVDEVIFRLAGRGVRPKEIRELLAADGCGLGYRVEMPRRTMTDHLRRLREERGDPRLFVPAGEEPERTKELRHRAFNEAYRRAWEILERGPSGAKDWAELHRCHRAMHQFLDTQPQFEASQVDAQRSNAAKAKHRAEAGSFYEQIARKEAEREAAASAG